MKTELSIQEISKKIFFIRGQKVMLDSDLASLYGVETGILNRAVRRNISRFPADFMFQLIEKEAEYLRCQIGISNDSFQARGGRRYLPLVFTENGVAMLSSVLKSERAILVNIEIMRAFVKMREMILSNKELAQKIIFLEKKYDSQFKIIFETIKQLIQQEEVVPKKIGIVSNND